MAATDCIDTNLIAQQATTVMSIFFYLFSFRDLHNSLVDFHLNIWLGKSE